jgi:crossover junction endodeoxyribonuclease RuvC
MDRTRVCGTRNPGSIPGESTDMIILGIDPGYDRCGIAILDFDERAKKQTLVFSDCLTSDKKAELSLRIFGIYTQVKEIISIYKPESLICENIAFSNNQKTALSIAEVIGSLCTLALDCNLNLLRLSPQEIKAAVAGSGAAKKEDIYRMLPYLISFPKNLNENNSNHYLEKLLDDERDAIAIALTGGIFLKHHSVIAKNL